MICRGSEVNATRAIGDQSDQTTEHERTEVETRGDPDAKRRCDARRQRYRSRRRHSHTQVRTASKTPHDPETWHAVNVLSVCVMRLVCRPGVSMKILNEAIQRHLAHRFSAPASPDTRQRTTTTTSHYHNSSIQQIHISGHALSRVALMFTDTHTTPLATRNDRHGRDHTSRTCRHAAYERTVTSRLKERTLTPGDAQSMLVKQNTASARLRWASCTLGKTDRAV